jgi:hypothetical protein
MYLHYVREKNENNKINVLLRNTIITIDQFYTQESLRDDCLGAIMVRTIA